MEYDNVYVCSVCARQVFDGCLFSRVIALAFTLAVVYTRRHLVITVILIQAEVFTVLARRL